MIDVQISIVGTLPLLVHSQEGMNRANPKAREMALLNKKRPKTDEDYDKISDLEMELGLYWDHKRDVAVMPVFNIIRCIQDGAKMMKGGKDVIRGIRIHPKYIDAEIIYSTKKLDELQSFVYKKKNIETERIEFNSIDLPKLSFAEFLADPSHRDVRTVTVSGTVNRTRPRFDEWGIEAVVLVDESILEIGPLNAFIEKGGLYCGLGDFRVATKKGGRYGTFEGVATKVKGD